MYQIRTALSRNNLRFFYFSKIAYCSIGSYETQRLCSGRSIKRGRNLSQGLPCVNTFFTSMRFFLRLFQNTKLSVNNAVFLRQHATTLSFCKTVFSFFDYFFGATFTKRFFPTRRTYSPADNSASISLNGCSFTSTAPC